MIILKCTRCGHSYGEPEDGWVTCPKCAFSAFVGKVEPKEEEAGAGEEPLSPQQGGEEAPEPEEEEGNE